jgi:hypothetical protein
VLGVNFENGRTLMLLLLCGLSERLEDRKCEGESAKRKRAGFGARGGAVHEALHRSNRGRPGQKATLAARPAMRGR